MNAQARRDPEETKAKILAAATSLFTEKGLAAASISEIAQEAGVTKSLIHHYFGSKDALWEEVKRSSFVEYYLVQKAMLENVETPGRELLESSVIAYFRFLQKHPETVRLIGWRQMECDVSCQLQEDELFDLGVARISEAQREGKLRADLDPFMILKVFLNMVFSWFQTRELAHSRLHSEMDAEALDEAYLKTIIAIYFEGLAPR